MSAPAPQPLFAGRAPTSPASCWPGVVRVEITFAPGGSVTSASLDGPPFAGTAVGTCIVEAFRGVRVPAYEGRPINVSKSVAINGRGGWLAASGGEGGPVLSGNRREAL